MSKTILPDTGFWYALFTQKDAHHDNATAVYADIQRYRILIPWPIHYEVLRTRFVRNSNALIGYHRLLKASNMVLLDDGPYRNSALEQVLTLQDKNCKGETLSLIDAVINRIIADRRIKIDYFITYNRKDFELSLGKRKNIIIL